MLQRAASNAYSWWWASHIRTKQSKWLEENLQDMEEMINEMVLIIDDDGDSFAQRAEMYYRKRPELLNYVEESFRSYRALAERYDHLSRELQSANRTIATVYPEQVQFSIDEDEEESLQKAAAASSNPGKTPEDLSDASKSKIPKVPRPPPKDLRSPSMILSRKGQIKRTTSSIKAAKYPSSGLNKTEALEEIDKLQKGILALQTEKEFVKCLYEHNYTRYWDIEDQISEIQTRVCNLQDEFGIGTFIEDDEARILMAATALRSCQAALAKLQARQGQSIENAKAESLRIKEADAKFQNLKDNYLTGQIDGQDSANAEEFNELGDSSTKDQERHDLEMLRKKVKHDLDVNSASYLSVTQLTETIDELVDKVVSLETEVSSQATLVKQLQSETNELQVHIRNFEEDKDALREDSDYMKRKLKELEEELKRVKYLSRSFKEQNNNIQTKFTETGCKLDHLNERLPQVKLEEEMDDTGLFQKKKHVTATREEDVEQRGRQASYDTSSVSEEMAMEESKKSEEEKSCDQSKSGSNLDFVSEVSKEATEYNKDINRELSEEHKTESEEESSSWRHRFLDGSEDREKILLEEYSAVLRNYNDVKKKLNEVEKKNRDGVFELTMQIRELRHANSTKDQQIDFLRQRLNSSSQTCLEENLETGSQYAYSHHEGSQECITEVDNTPELNYFIGNSTQQPSDDPLADYKSTGRSSIVTEENKAANVDSVSESQTSPVHKRQAPKTIVQKLRSDIDYLLEENLEFWLRFSTAFHQIQKFQTSIRDLQAEWSKVKDTEVQDESMKNQYLRSEARPIFKHLREIQTELTLWLENNTVLQEELQARLSSLSYIQEEISGVANEGSKAEEAMMSPYQAAKFQGEVLNMKQESSKIVNQLQSGLDRVKGLQVEVGKTLEKLEDELGISMSKSHSSSTKSSSSRPRIPLRSFLFGIKLKKQKQAKQSRLSFVNPALQKEYSDLATGRRHLV